MKKTVQQNKGEQYIDPTSRHGFLKELEIKQGLVMCVENDSENEKGQNTAGDLFD